MTDRKLDNSLYIHLKSAINQALPLEYAIRATKQANPHELEQLSAIDLMIRQSWIDLGATDAEIDAESLMDLAWDMIQVGIPLMRRHGRRYTDREFRDLIDQGMRDIAVKFHLEAKKFIIPASRYFRVCDLLRGNDILRLLNAVALCLRDARDFEASAEIELERFVRGIREPIHLHPGVAYVFTELRKGNSKATCFGIALDPEIEFSVPDLKRQIREYLYQYAVFRESAKPQDRSASEWINEFLSDEMFGRADEHKVTRLDGFVSILTGLYCWDLVQKYRQEGTEAPLETAITETLKIYPANIRSVGDGAIKKNYYTARKTIAELTFPA